jgi:CxxC motif-containing protein (DUF1111 family)
VILAQEDPDDRDGDGVRGIASRVEVRGREEIGRFGWRAQAPTIADFVCAALGAEIGLTVADVGRDFGVVEDPDAADDPELPTGDLDHLVFFCRSLAPPEPAEISSAEQVVATQRGEIVFEAIGCATCHVPALQSAQGPVQLYSDLLLHNVAPPLDEDGRKAGEPAAFRTPPLWGVRDTAPYLHDGRAETLDAAIRAHGGEAARSADRYAAIPVPERDALIAFLRSL